MRVLVSLIVALAVLNGCGFKGPLYLPQEKGAPVTAETSPQRK